MQIHYIYSIVYARNHDVKSEKTIKTNRNNKDFLPITFYVENFDGLSVYTFFLFTPPRNRQTELQGLPVVKNVSTTDLVVSRNLI